LKPPDSGPTTNSKRWGYRQITESATEEINRPDTRRDYHELREIGYALIDARLYCVVFTQRGDTLHIISLRKANSREVRDVQES
jgi:uncharacterized DUF497 family protein